MRDTVARLSPGRVDVGFEVLDCLHVGICGRTAGRGQLQSRERTDTRPSAALPVMRESESHSVAHLPRDGVQILRLDPFRLFALSNVLIPRSFPVLAVTADVADFPSREVFELDDPVLLLLPQEAEDFIVAEEPGAVVESLAQERERARVWCQPLFRGCAIRGRD